MPQSDLFLFLVFAFGQRPTESQGEDFKALLCSRLLFTSQNVRLGSTPCQWEHLVMHVLVVMGHRLESG